MGKDTNISYVFRIVLPVILGIFVGNLLYFKFFVTTNLRTDKVIRDTIIVKDTIFIQGRFQGGLFIYHKARQF